MRHFVLVYLSLICLFIAPSVINAKKKGLRGGSHWNRHADISHSGDNSANGKTNHGGFNLGNPSKTLPPSSPLNDLTTHLVDIHFYSGNLEHQYITHHYCAYLYEGFRQCVLLDETNTHLLGTEFVISKEIFEKLDEEEKVLWHSHVYEVKSGLLVVLDATPEEEWKTLKNLVGTYGKVIDVWHDGLDFPKTGPLLANALALDSQVDWAVAERMDRILNLDTTYAERRKMREALPWPEKAEGADQYLVTGLAPQFETYFIKLEDNGKVFSGNK